MSTDRNRRATELQHAALQGAKGRLDSLLNVGKKGRLQVRLEGGRLVLYRERRFGGQRPEWVQALRLTPLGSKVFGLSVRSRRDRWERTPFSGELPEVVKIMTTALAHFLASPW